MSSSAEPAAGEARTVAGHAFLSYVREDSAHVDRLQQILEVADIPVWRDSVQLWPGQDWRAQIRSAITRDALAFLACFSQASVARAQSYQNEELNVAIEQLRLRPRHVTWLIPIRFDYCEIPDWDIGSGRTLQYLHYADLFGDRYHQNAERLVQVVRQILGHGREAEGRSASVARKDRAPEISIAEPDASDTTFNPPVRSVVYIEVNEPIDDLTSCYVTDQNLGGTTDLGHAPIHISTSRWRIRSEFLLRSVRDVIIGYTITRAGRKVQRFQWDGYDRAYDWHALGADGSHLSALHQIKQVRQTDQGADRQLAGKESPDRHKPDRQAAHAKSGQRTEESRHRVDQPSYPTTHDVVSLSMPPPGGDITEATVVRWMKRVGDHLEVDEPLLELSVDGLDIEITSPISGVLREIVTDEDETVAMGGEICVIEADGWFQRDDSFSDIREASREVRRVIEIPNLLWRDDKFYGSTG
jgi:biotin carboxyl carrier protein